MTTFSFAGFFFWIVFESLVEFGLYLALSDFFNKNEECTNDTERIKICLKSIVYVWLSLKTLLIRHLMFGVIGPKHESFLHAQCMIRWWYVFEEGHGIADILGSCCLLLCLTWCCGFSTWTYWSIVAKHVLVLRKTCLLNSTLIFCCNLCILKISPSASVLEIFIVEGWC